MTSAHGGTTPPCAKPSDRVCGGRGIGDGGARGKPWAFSRADQIAQQPCLAAMQMRAAGDVDPHPVRRIGRPAARSGPAASRRERGRSPGEPASRPWPWHQGLRLQQRQFRM